MFQTRLNLLAADEPDLWIVNSPLVWVDPEFGIITVPTGAITDLASVPQVLRNILDVNGRARRPAVIHDWLYRKAKSDAGRVLARSECDNVFYQALRSDGAGIVESRTYWLGVRAGGWKPWDQYRAADQV